MPDANALSYRALQDRVLGRRFPAASQRANAKSWLATAYQDVWAAGDWQFRRVSMQPLTVTAGDPTPAMPVDFADVIALYDEQGYELLHLSQEDLERESTDLASQAVSDFYTVVNRQIILSPIPGAQTLRLSYRRRIAHKQADGITVSVGFMDADDDYPLWDDHHAILIPRATAIGLLELNDPTWQQAQEEYERQLVRMREDYEYVRPQKQWGKVSWVA